ncbi:leucine-rich repeat protein [uncultured Eubacterium sp.]|uniref:leucine-rich repeat protein n=1 Tax=uncultured Eubacterium sp. TaxID=165185 RepID=UPI002597D47B|nr:leucine-rich repeat protein [uncultured Eubacterium sp.]
MFKKLVCVLCAVSISVCGFDGTFDMVNKDVFAATISEDEYNALVSKAQSMKSSYNSAVKKYNRGSIGFFDSVNSDNAIKLLKKGINIYKNNKTLKSKSYLKAVDKGDSVSAALKDSTSLENMKKSIAYIKECNDIRGKLGLDAFKVSDELMAQAQTNVNYAAKETDHAKDFDTAENLSWGYSDPFQGWYHDEHKWLNDAIKAGTYPGIENMDMYEIYKTYPAFFAKIGHYFNVISKTYKYTGFALVKGTKYGNGIAYSQVYTGVLDRGIMDFDKYEQRFLDYYNPIVNTINEYESLMNQINSYEVEQFGVGKKITKSKVTYQITSKTTAVVCASKKNAKSVKIADTVTVGGRTYEITEIKAGAFKNRKKLKKVVIGAKVSVIGKKAFYNCKKLKNVKIKSVVLKKVGKSAFKNTHKNIKFMIKKSKFKSYKKKIKKSGTSKKAVYKKF